jgi:hypothetical protein
MIASDTTVDVRDLLEARAILIDHAVNRARSVVINRRRGSTGAAAKAGEEIAQLHAGIVALAALAADLREADS